jgi:hypothetical protein
VFWAIVRSVVLVRNDMLTIVSLGMRHALDRLLVPSCFTGQPIVDTWHILFSF